VTLKGDHVSTGRYYVVKWGSFAAVCTIHTFVYIFFNHFFHPAKYYNLATPLDYAIPLIPAWSWIYEMLFIIPLAMGFITDIGRFLRGCVAVLACCAVSWVFFIVLPVTTAGYRPDTVDITGPSTMLLGFIYFSDAPGTCFPSLHVAVGMTTAFIAIHLWGWRGFIYMLANIMVLLSTLFTKQHYIADVVAGTILAYVSYRIFFAGRLLERYRIFKTAD